MNKTDTHENDQMIDDNLLRHFSPEVITRAKQIVSHLLLPDGAQALHMDCDTGGLTALMAHMNTRVQFIGISRNRQMIMRARARFKKFDLPNLSFEIGDPFAPRKHKESVDAIIGSRMLGEIFTRQNYNENHIADTLSRHFDLLKNDGVMILHDYLMPAEDEFVQIEFPVPVRDKRFHRLYASPIGETQGEREIALLQWFAENARARDGVKGFYMEELPPHVPYTRVFRLPAKWAYEFIIRKTDMRKFKSHIKHQYTCATEHDLDRIMGRVLGARIVHTSPWRNPHVIRTHYEGSFRLYTSAGKTRGYMPTGHVMVAQKIANGQPLLIGELRPSNDPVETLTVQAVRDEKSGDVVDIVTRAGPRAEIIPYFFSTEGRLKVVLRADAGRGIANLSPRARHNLDGKRWSGHMVVAPAIPIEALEGVQKHNHDAAKKIMDEHFGLTPLQGQGFNSGPMGYPAPSMIDELLETLFVKIKQPDFSKLRMAGPQDALGLKIYDVEDILRACGSGFIPSAWLDIQMQSLMKRCGLKVIPWLHESVPLSYEPPPSDQLLRAGKILKQKPKSPDKDPGDMYVMGKKNTKWPKVFGSFKPVRGKVGQIATMRSSFVEQGHKDGAIHGLSSTDMDFACPQNDMVNIAAILPLTEDLSGNTLMGFELKELPVPSRFGQDDAMMNLPTIPLPNTITNIDEARAYIAEQFDVELKRVATMGESFFTFIDMMPQRVFPFCLTRYPRRRNLKLRYRAMTDLLDLTDTDFADSILWKWGLAQAHLCQGTTNGANWAPRAEASARIKGQQSPKWSNAANNKSKRRNHNP